MAKQYERQENLPDRQNFNEMKGGLASQKDELVKAEDTFARLKAELEKIGIERIGTVGEPFDPNFHNAIMREDSAEYETDTVIREFQGGYKIGDRVIRPAIVVVAS